MRSNHPFFVILLIVRIFLQFMPLLDSLTSIFINLPILALLYGYIIIKSKRNLIPLIIAILPIFIAPIIELLTVGKLPVLNVLYTLFYWLLWPLIGIFISDQLSLKSQKVVFWSFFICFIITAITTIYGCTLYPLASRSQANGNFVVDNADIVLLYKSMNIGDFQFIYTLVLLTPIVMCLSKYLFKRKIIGYLILILFLYTIYITQYTTALVLAGFAAIYLLLPISHDNRKASKWFIFIFVLSLFVLPLISSFIGYVSSALEGDVLKERLSELSQSLSGQQLDESSDFGTRIILWRLSLNTFFDNFITGVYFITDYSQAHTYIGGHSFILDTMARFGITGLLLLIWMFVTQYKLFIKPYRARREYIFYLMVYVLNLVQCLINTVSIEIVFVFIIPLVASILRQESQKTNYTTIEAELKSEE